MIGPTGPQIPTPAEIAALLHDLRVTPGDGPALARPALGRYAGDHAARFAIALRQIAAWTEPGRQPRILELGAAPYCFTALLCRSMRCDLTCVSTPPAIWPGEIAGVRETTVRLELGASSWRVPGLLMNVERDRLPFAAGSFDLVLCMDLLHHLGYHPTLMLYEARRVLRPGGRLLLTLPNGLSLWRLLWLLGGIVDAPPFAARGMYERRQRHSAPAELAQLVSGCGFRIERFDYLNLEPLPAAGWPRRLMQAARALTRLPLPALRRRRDYLLLTAAPQGEPRAAYPPGIYHQARLYPPPGDPHQGSFS